MAKDDAARTGPVRSSIVPVATGLAAAHATCAESDALPVASGSGWYLKTGNDMRSPSARMAGEPAIPMRTDIVPQHARVTAKPRPKNGAPTKRWLGNRVTGLNTAAFRSGLE